MIKNISGNLLDATEKFIVHQTNIVVIGKASGIAGQIFSRFPWSDCYAVRKEHSIPGTIDIRGDGVEERFVVNLHGQYYPGKFNNDFPNDSEKMRRNYFHRGLVELSKVKNLESVAFPFQIGCGLAGGDWSWYLGELENFEEHVYQSFGVKVSIYHLPGSK